MTVTTVPISFPYLVSTVSAFPAAAVAESSESHDEAKDDHQNTYDKSDHCPFVYLAAIELLFCPVSLYFWELILLIWN